MNANREPHDSANDAPPAGPITAATDRLIATAATFDDAALHRRSLCPGWTRGHVLTHVARSADAFTHLLTWARTGRRGRQTSQQPTMYPTNDARDVDIETGATRPAVDVVADLQASAQRFAKAIMDMSDDGWERTVRPGIGGTGEAVPGRRVLWLRLRELELRHVDLDAGYVPASWPSAFVERALDEAMRSLSRRDDVPSMIVRVEGGVTERVGSDAEVTVTGSPAAILGWLTGRAAGTDVHCEPHGALPVLPAWW